MASDLCHDHRNACLSVAIVSVLDGGEKKGRKKTRGRGRGRKRNLSEKGRLAAHVGPSEEHKLGRRASKMDMVRDNVRRRVLKQARMP